MNPNRPIRDIMTTELVTIKPETTALEMKSIFERHGFHHLLVVGKGEKLVGIVSKSDFLKLNHFFSLDQSLGNTSDKRQAQFCAEDIMTKHPLSLDPEDTIGLAADIFLVNRFHALPIVEDERLAGLVTTHDLLLFSYGSPIPDVEDGA